MKTIKVTASIILAGILLSCGSNTGKKEETTEVKKDTVAEVKTAPAFDTIDIYIFKGKEPYINNDYLKTASEEEKALLAYYSYFFNTSCVDTKHCKLTEALGFGEQNSKEQQTAVLKWFNDEETKQLAKEGGRIKLDGADPGAWFESIKLVKKGALIVVRYISKWKTKTMEGTGVGTDEYEFEPSHIKVIGRTHEDI
ncbi:MAG: hypothetical protein ACXVC6_14415 [Bacteroidia bacterium]